MTQTNVSSLSIVDEALKNSNVVQLKEVYAKKDRENPQLDFQPKKQNLRI